MWSARSSSRYGCSRVSRSSSAITSACRPAASRISISVSIATRRSSSRRADSAWSAGWAPRSSNGVPRQSPSASSISSAAPSGSVSAQRPRLGDPGFEVQGVEAAAIDSDPVAGSPALDRRVRAPCAAPTRTTGSCDARSPADRRPTARRPIGPPTPRGSARRAAGRARDVASGRPTLEPRRCRLRLSPRLRPPRAWDRAPRIAPSNRSRAVSPRALGLDRPEMNAGPPPDRLGTRSEIDRNRRIVPAHDAIPAPIELVSVSDPLPAR